jgi:hypothetical protein
MSVVENSGVMQWVLHLSVMLLANLLCGSVR